MASRWSVEKTRLDRLGPFMHNIKHAFFLPRRRRLKIFATAVRFRLLFFNTPKGVRGSPSEETLKLRELTLLFTLRRQLWSVQNFEERGEYFIKLAQGW